MGAVLSIVFWALTGLTAIGITISVVFLVGLAVANLFEWAGDRIEIFRERGY